MNSQTIIIGASAAGLACAAHLKKRGLDFILLEKSDRVAQSWRNHYDRLHLHTHKGASNLPFLKFPKNTPKYPSKQQVIDYLENYAKNMAINPRFNCEVTKVQVEKGTWITKTQSGEKYESQNVIFCTGYANTPRSLVKPGLDSFPGKVIHSSEYKNGSEFNGKKVLVIGFGNSACEIAIDLHEHGAETFMSVRSPVNIIPKEILGIPVLTIGIFQSNFPPRISDKLNKPLLKFLIGDFTKYGLRKLPYGPREQIVNHHQIPLLDLGTLDLIKKGFIKIHDDIKNIKGNNVQFQDGFASEFDTIVYGTGYQRGLEKMIDLTLEEKKSLESSVKNRVDLGSRGLYFCGLYVSPTGMLREISIESKIIADHITERSK